MNFRINKLVKIALLAAMSLVLRCIEFPVIPLFPWLKIDLSDIPALLGGLSYGPVVGVIIELLKNILVLFVKGTESAFVGELANFLIGCALIIPLCILYKKSTKSFIIGSIISLVFAEVAGILTNVYILLPAYGMAMSSEEIMKYVYLGLIPFNAIKAIMVFILSFILYKKLSSVIFNNERYIKS